MWSRLTTVLYVSVEVSERVPNLAKVLASTCEKTGIICAYSVAAA